MASGKKGKKTKGKTIALTEFLQETTGSVHVQPIRKSTTNWADEVEDFDGYDSRKPVNVVLPTAPKASRDYDDITNKVPMEPPFCAYLSNLPYDADEDEIAAFFKNMKITNMRIPRDDRGSDGTRSKGYGYIEFEDRESLLEALVLRETTLKNRRMRIEVASNMDSRRTGRMDIGRDRGDRGESLGDWRSGPRTEPLADNDRRGGFNRDRDSGFGREREGGFTRDGMRNPDRDDRSFNRDGRESSFRRDRDSQDDRLGNWRDGDRPNREMERDKERDRGFNRDRGNFRDSERGREERRGFGPRRFENDRDGPTRDDRESERVNSEPRERPKLILAPRTKPIENVPVNESVPSAAIFGNAKPVDTTQREKEIEEKIAKGQSDTRSDSRDRQKHHSVERKRSVERNKFSRRADDSPHRDRKDVSPKRSPSKRSSPRRSSPRRASPRRSSPRRASPRRSSPRRASPRRSSPRRTSPRRSSPRRASPRRSSPRRASPRRSSPRRASPRRSSPRRASPRRSSPRRSSPRRTSPRRASPKRTPARRNSPRRQSPKRNYDEKKGPPKNDHKSPEKNDKVKNEKPKREEKRDRHDKEMPKMTEPEPPNFAANNKFAFLETEDNSD